MSDEEPRSGHESLKDGLRRFLDGRSSFLGMSRSDIEGLISELMGHEGKGRERVEDLFEEVRARSRQGVDRVGETIRSEVRREFDILTPERREKVGEFLERLVGLIGEYFGAGRHRDDHGASPHEAPVEAIAAGPPAKKAPAKKAAAKKAPAGVSGTKKAPAKKAAKKSPSA